MKDSSSLKASLERAAELADQPLLREEFAHVVAHIAQTRDGQEILSHALGAQAYAVGGAIAFKDSSPGLHTAAHEAAHVIQQNQTAVEFLQRRAKRR